MTELACIAQTTRLNLSLQKTDPLHTLSNRLPGNFPTRVAFLRSLRHIEQFSLIFGKIRLRRYQLEAANAIVDSVLGGQGLSIVVMFPRQSGKNLLQAQLEVYLMALLGRQGAEMVKLSPTYQPQSLNAMRRLETALQANYLTHNQWHKSAGNHYRFKNAHLTFLSAAPGSNIVGATASTLLQLDEAQDIGTEKYDKQIAPMAASTNATRVFWGTAWTGQTLLARELRAARQAEARDGIRRVFQLGAEEVRAEVPAYGRFVDERVARLGRSHPMVRSQFFSEEIDFASGLFSPARFSLMLGNHIAQTSPQPGKTYALLVDLAGEDEQVRLGNYTNDSSANLENPNRDSTAVTVVEVDLSLVAQVLPGKPRYRVVQRYLWQGEKHSTLYQRLYHLAQHWGVAKMVVDGSGVGAGVCSFLRDQLGERVIPLVFNRQVKSKLGWGFLSVIDTGRFQDFRSTNSYTTDTGQANPLAMRMINEQERLQALFQRQLQAVSCEASIGPERFLKWSVPEGTADPLGGLLHDDLVISAAMTAILDEQEWRISLPPQIIQASDPIKEMDGGF
ncbi:MAG: hypothetical protein PHW11_02340 [Anaerolineaceae bacterium]|jgi:hypothetical protein|nr:hypothetical protein [Anaerolineaceae bacterium]MDD4043094.1 hypothetical protein [Anaerolineaceae bacterium]MDD4576969.1 hypothetical protein [Anaerolineaceae bacterium]